MKLGQKAMEALRREVAGRLRAGDDLVAVGCIALQGTALLVKYERETLRRIFLRDSFMMRKKIRKDTA